MLPKIELMYHLPISQRTREGSLSEQSHARAFGDDASLLSARPSRLTSVLAEMTLHPIPSAARRLSPPDPLAISQPVPPARAPTDSLAAAVGSLPQADGVVGLTYAAPPAAAPATVLPSQRLTTQLSDLLLSAVVPGIPPASSSAAAADAGPRKLSSRKEELNLTSTTGNFRKFVLKVGVVFWLQDRIEEVFTWRKPAWSVCFALAWALIGRSACCLWSLTRASGDAC